MQNRKLHVNILFILTVLFAGLSFQGVCQSEADTVSDDKIYVVVDNPPFFPGGMQALRTFIAENTVYPEEALSRGIEGKVILQFVIDKKGKVTNVQVVRLVNELLDDEALRVIKMLPDWEPGTKKGEAVNVRYTIPVEFSLPKE